MKESEFRNKLTEWRIANGREPYWIYMNNIDFDELVNDSMSTYAHHMEFYEIIPTEHIEKGQIAMKALPYLQVSVDGKITNGGKVIGNIEFESEWTSYRARDKIILHWR